MNNDGYYRPGYQDRPHATTVALTRDGGPSLTERVTDRVGWDHAAMLLLGLWLGAVLMRRQHKGT